MDIMITFEDGTTELRDGTSPLLVRHRWLGHQWASPSVDAVIDLRPYYCDGWGLWLVTAEDRLLDTCAATVQLSARRGDRGWVWCITGGRAKGEPLTGEWRACKVESVAEQIERLTRERDVTARRLRAAVSLGVKLGRRWKASERRIADLRAWAEHEAREWGAVFPEDESTWHEVLRRIDGKEDT